MRVRRIFCLTNLGIMPPYQLGNSYGLKTMPLSPGNMIILKEKGGMRDSFPRHLDKNSRGPQGERDLKFSRRKKGQTLFFFPSNPVILKQ